MNEESISQKISQDLAELPWLHMGGAFLSGLAVGYALKKSFKILLLLTGFILIAVYLFESQHIIKIDDVALSQTVAKGGELFNHLAIFLKARLGNLELVEGGSAGAGFLLGLKMG